MTTETKTLTVEEEAAAARRNALLKAQDERQAAWAKRKEPPPGFWRTLLDDIKEARSEADIDTRITLVLRDGSALELDPFSDRIEFHHRDKTILEVMHRNGRELKYWICLPADHVSYVRLEHVDDEPSVE